MKMRKHIVLASLVAVALGTGGFTQAKGPGGGGQGYDRMSSQGAANQNSQQMDNATRAQQRAVERHKQQDKAMKQKQSRVQDGSGAQHETRSQARQQNTVETQQQTRTQSQPQGTGDQPKQLQEQVKEQTRQQQRTPQ